MLDVHADLLANNIETESGRCFPGASKEETIT